MAGRSNRSYVVVGLGAFGGTVAAELARFGNPVLGIDMNERNVSRFADVLTEAVICDATDEAALREAGAANHNVALVAIGEDLESEILAVMNLRHLGIQTIWVKAKDRTQHRIFSKLGVDRVILPEQEIGQHIAQMLHNPLVRDYISLGNGYHVVDFRVPEELNGRRVNEPTLFAAHDLRVLGLMREGGAFHSCADGSVTLKSDDKLLILGKRQDLRQFGDMLRQGL